MDEPKIAASIFDYAKSSEKAIVGKIHGNVADEDRDEEEIDLSSASSSVTTSTTTEINAMISAIHELTEINPDKISKLDTETLRAIYGKIQLDTHKDFITTEIIKALQEKSQSSADSDKSKSTQGPTTGPAPSKP